MLPEQLTADSFAGYPPKARDLAVKNLALLRQLPLGFAPLLLRETQGYDWRFPAEQRLVDDQFVYLQALSSDDRDRLFRGFAAISLPTSLEAIDWVSDPQDFLDTLTSQLWASHQIGAFRAAANDYVAKWRAVMPEPPPALPRLSVVVLGADVKLDNYPLFRKLRPYGVFFPRVDSDNAWPAIVAALTKRAAAHPVPYGHLYVDGAVSDPAAAASLNAISYGGLHAVRDALFARMQQVIRSGHGGPEELRTKMAQITPKELGLRSAPDDEAMSRFAVSILTEGSGTQIFSTTFVQWSAREALRRAQPCTLLLRFAPRQRQLPMNEMLSAKDPGTVSDPGGSMMDADMGAFYTWINQQRLTGHEQSAFLAWSQEHAQAVAIGPGLPLKTVSAGAVTMPQLLSQVM